MSEGVAARSRDTRSSEVERARLFVALPLPARVAGVVASWRDGVLAGIGGLRPVPVDSLHVTLCFLGWVAVSEVPPIAAVCRGVASEPAAALTLAGAAWLPPRRSRVLAVSLDDEERRLGHVQALVSRELAAGGWYVPERRPFFAHVTVARVPSGARVRALDLGAPPSVSFAGVELTLFRSRPGAGGARYEALERVMLGSPDEGPGSPAVTAG